jgi:HEAT repeat protein
MLGVLLRTAIFLIVAVQLACGQSQAANPLRDFFDNLVDRYDPSSLPTHDQLLKVTRPIATAHRKEITNALPSVFRAVEHPNDDVKLYAVGALIPVAFRADSAELLRDYISRFAPLLASSEKNLQEGAVTILAYLQPKPPPATVAVLVEFLKRNDRHLHAQTLAIGALIQADQSSPEAIAAIENFLSRPFDESTRIDALNVLGNQRTNESRLVQAVVRELDNRDTGVKLAAVRALGRIGKRALQAQPKLEAIAQDQTQPAEVRREARQALDSVRR